MDINNDIYELTFFDEGGNGNLSETFCLTYFQHSNMNETTHVLPILATASDVEDALNMLNCGLVSVSREDHSIIYEGFDILDIDKFKIVHRITFLEDCHEADLEVGGGLNTIDYNITKNHGSKNRNLIVPKLRAPSAPQNVKLYVISETELGVSWKKPNFNGGLPIQKYVVEWDKDYTMLNSKVSNINPYSNKVNGPLVQSSVVDSNSTRIQITGLDKNTEYFVRVIAVNMKGHSKACLQM